MRITPIQARQQAKLAKFEHQKQQQAPTTNTINELPPTNPAYYQVSFTGAWEKANKEKFIEAQENFTPISQQQFLMAEEIAKQFGHTKLTMDHIYLQSLLNLNMFIEELDSGEKNYDNEKIFQTPEYMAYCAEIPDLIKNAEKRAKFKPLLEEEIALQTQNLANSNIPVKKHAKPTPTPEMMADINDMYSVQMSAGEGEAYLDNFFLMSVLNSHEPTLKKQFMDFLYRVQDELMVDKAPEKQKTHLKFYDEKADKIWRNLDIGNDVFITYDNDNSESSKYLISSFANLINKPGQSYKTLNNENTEIIFFNDDVTFDFIDQKMKKNRKENDKHQIFIFDMRSAIKNTGIARGTGAMQVNMNDYELLMNKNREKNKQQLVLISNKDSHLANTAPDAGLAKPLKHFNLLSIPMLNGLDTIEMFLGEKGAEFIKNQTQKEWTEDAIRRAVEISSHDNGYFPEKVIEYMKKVSSYFTDESFVDSENGKAIGIEEIELFELENADTKQVKASSDDFKIVFDTKKRIDDIVGTPMTKAEAMSVVELIKRGKKGATRGFTMYLEDGSSYGGGRRHTAEAIAGEAGIPMISINARDFALKDLDALSQSMDLSEVKIKKLINTAKTQAETNKNKTAMIFIENFDNFGSDPLYGVSSIYEQKAFSQLLVEMENVRKNENVNLIIVGSTNRPELLDENIMKPYKFLDRIVIYPPQDTGDRTDIFNYYIEKNGYKIAGADEKERAEIIDRIAQTTKGFSVVDIMYLLDKADDVATQRGKDSIDRADFTEAYLQTTTGRVSNVFHSDASKRIVTSHECGHALTLQYMYDLAQKQEKPWHLPNLVDFITLDPRGSYGGAVFMKDSKNEEWSFEKNFAEIVCSFGGYSSEKEFYNMDGSWGITQDMQTATYYARLAVQNMGMGARTGRISLIEHKTDLSENMREKIDEDTNAILKNAEKVSNLIVQTYSGLVEEFTDKYASKVGTGECIIMSDEFIAFRDEWLSRQTPEKLAEIEALDAKVLEIIDKTKKGEIA